MPPWLLFFGVVSSWYSVFALVPEEQITVLHALFNSTNGDHWKSSCNEKWSFTEDNDPCQNNWYGVKCNVMGEECTTNSTCLIYQLGLVECGLSGTVPPELNQLTSLVMLYMGGNNLYSTLPSLSELKDISTVDFNRCNLTGPLPSLPDDLFTLILSRNRLTSTLSSLSSLSSLFMLELTYNMFTGPVPPLSTSLVALYLSNNLLSQTLPPDYTSYTTMQAMKLSDNHLWGPLPSFPLGVMYIDLSSNDLSQTFPDSLYQLTRLTSLILSDNLFHSTISSSIGQLTSRNSQLELMLDNNVLYGSLPAQLFTSSITYLYLDHNTLESSLPSTFYLMRQINILDISCNYLTGPVSDDIRLMYISNSLNFSYNLFSGSLPSSLFSVGSGIGSNVMVDVSNNEFSSNLDGIEVTGNVVWFDISHNHISGAIAEQLFDSSSALQYGYFQHNAFDGTLPCSLNDNINLKQLIFSHNLLEGTLPAFSNMYYLQTLLLDHNRFHGKPGSSFFNYTANSTELEHLQIVDLSDNDFTGTLPREIFLLKDIFWVAIVKNCFHGALLKDICNAKSLQVLVLEGLRSGNKCNIRSFSFGFRSDSTYITTGMAGEIPKCIWSMPNLQLLHLSGNQLTGTLPNSISSPLRDLTLSYNAISGVIPKAFQQHGFYSLDLSHNMIAGTLKEDSVWGERTVKTKLKLHANRLSGNIPKQICDLEKVDILDGNRFACDDDELPANDPARAHYVCGSNDLDFSLASYGALFGVGLLCLLVSYVALYPCNAYLSRAAERLRDITSYLQLCYGTAYALSPQASPQLYGFLSTLRYLRDITLRLTLFICVFMSSYIIAFKFDPDAEFITVSHQRSWVYSALYLTGVPPAVVLLLLYVIFILFFLYGIYSMTEACSSDISGILKKESEVVMTVTSYIFLTAIVLLDVAVVLTVKASFVMILYHSSTSAEVKYELQVCLAAFDIFWNYVVLSYLTTLYPLPPHRRIKAYVFLLFFNSIIAVSLTTFFTDSNCFADVVSSVSPIVTQGDYVYCSSIDVVTQQCSSNDIINLSTSYYPPFTYSYQCMNNVFTLFIPVFIFNYAFLAFVRPVLLVIFAQYENSDYLSYILPTILWPRTAHLYDKMKIINAGVIISAAMHHIAVLVTFGFLFPPLAIIITIVMALICTTWHIIIGRYMRITQEIEQRASLLISSSSSCIELCCENSWLGPYKCMWVIASMSGLYVSFFMFDIIGYLYTWRVSILIVAVPIIGLLFLLRLAVLFEIHEYLTSFRRKEQFEVVSQCEEKRLSYERFSFDSLAYTASVDTNLFTGLYESEKVDI